MKAQCVPAAIKVRKLTYLRQDSDSTVCLSSDDEASSKSRPVEIGAKKQRSFDSQSSTTSRPKMSEASDKSTPVVSKSVQKKITDYQMGASSKAQSSDVVLMDTGHACEHEKSKTPAEKPSTKRSKEYTFVNFNNEIEDQIKKCS